MKQAVAVEEQEAEAVQSEQGQTETEENEITVVETTPLDTRGHCEATCLAFTEVYNQDGQRWNLTLREGVTSGQLDKLFTAMQYTNMIGEKHGFQVGRINAVPQAKGEGQNAAPRPPPPASPPKPVSGGGPVPVSRPNKPAPNFAQATAPKAGRNGFEYNEITRLVIFPSNNAPDKPRVEFWGKPQLKFAITSCPASIVAAKLQERYEIADDELSFLYEVGAQWAVNWKIKLVDGEKLNSRGNPYKNLSEVIDLDREG